MHLRHLRLVDFRSWPLLETELQEGTTVLVGRNGFGKTNVLEAIWMLATLSSHRVSGDAPLVRIGADGALITSLAHNAGRELTVELGVNKGKPNRARLNTSPLRSPREILGVVQAVIFAPEDLALVRGEPANRRNFLDALAVQRRPRVAALRADYDKVLRQRTALLKTASAAMRRGAGPEALASIEVWDVELARLGAELVASRADLVETLRPRLLESYAQLAPTSRPADLAYVPRLRGARPNVGALVDTEYMEAVLLAEIAARRDDELARAQTLVGPHRDEVELTLGDEPAKGFASHGETWSFALALRLASLEVLREDGMEPILLLDDVFAELDSGRRAALAGVAAEVEQVLVTAAVPEDLPAGLGGARLRVDMHGEGRERASTLARETGTEATAHGDGDQA